MADPYKNNVVLYLPMEGSRHGDTVILDRTSKTVTRNGDVILSTAVVPPFGMTSAYFDGNGDTLQIADSALPELGTDSFTIECWAYFSVLDSTHRYVLAKRNTATGVNAPIMLGANASNQLRFAAAATDNSGYAVDMTGPTLTASVWTHLAVTRTGSTWRLFKDGVLVASATSSHSVYDIADDLAIGCGAYGGDAGARYYFNGYIKDLRITKGVARYTSNFFSPLITNIDDYWANVVLAIHGEGTGNTFIDISNSNRTITTYGNTTHSTSVTPPFGTSSIYFDGSVDFLSIPYNYTAFDWWSTAFCIEAWVYANSWSNWSYTPNTVPLSCLIGNRSIAANTTYWAFGPITDGTLRFYYWNGANQSASSSTVLSTGAWHHIAVQVLSNQIMLFADGVLESTTAISGTPQSSTSYDLVIGTGHSGTLQYTLTGYVKDLRITKGIARYTQNFTLNYLPFPDKTSINRTVNPMDWDKPEPVRIIL
jgi:hypothetical protein